MITLVTYTNISDYTITFSLILSQTTVKVNTHIVEYSGSNEKTLLTTDNGRFHESKFLFFDTHTYSPTVTTASDVVTLNTVLAVLYECNTILDENCLTFSLIQHNLKKL